MYVCYRLLSNKWTVGNQVLLFLPWRRETPFLAWFKKLVLLIVEGRVYVTGESLNLIKLCQGSTCSAVFHTNQAYCYLA